MNVPAAAARRLDAYLREVETHLAHHGPQERRELLEELRAHVLEALHRQGGSPPTVEDVERVLAGMDAPECFAASAPAARAAAAPPTTGRGGSRWFLLGLGLLLVNAYGVWRWTRPPAGPPAPVVTNGVPADVSRPAAALPVLRLAAIEQVNLTATREATLRLIFTAAPARDALPRFLSLSEEGDPELTYQLFGHAGSNVVLIQTEVISHDRFDYRLAAGLPAEEAGIAPGEEQAGAVPVRSQFQFQRLEAESPPFESCELRALFNSRPDANALASFVAIDPPVAFTAELLDSWRGGGMRLQGAFRLARCTR